MSNILNLEQKIGKQYVVKNIESKGHIKEVDMDQRTIKAVANTYFFIDNQNDMLIPGCCSKTISDRGPLSTATAKIKHQSDHKLDTRNTVGRITVLDERVIESKEVLYFESALPRTTKGNDDLINYQEGLYDNHSIGLRYVSLTIAEKDSSNPEYAKNWNEFYPKALNPEVADENGFFWVVKEIELFEISVVSYGSNSLTPYLGSKSKHAGESTLIDLEERISSLEIKAKEGKKKEEQKEISLEVRQLKEILSTLQVRKSEEKDTFERKPPIESTLKTNNLYSSFIKKHKK